MKKFVACLLVLAVSNPGFADVLRDNDSSIAPFDNHSSDFIIDHGNLMDVNGILVNPICTAPLQSPTLISDLNVVFESYAGVRVIKRGNGRYLLVKKGGSRKLSHPVTTEKTHWSSAAETSDPKYDELESSAAGNSILVIPPAPAYSTNSPTATSSCLAEAVPGSSELLSRFF